MEGIQAAGWRHRFLIIGLIVLGAVSIIAALGVPFVADKWPAIAGFMSGAATPSTWAVFGLAVAAYLLIGPQFKVSRIETSHSPQFARAHLQGLSRGSYDDKIQDLYDRALRLEERLTGLSAWTLFNPDSSVPPIGTSELAAELRASVEENREGLVNLVGEVQKLLLQRADEIASRIGEVERRTAFPANMGETLGEALSSAENCRLSQLARIRDEAKNLRQKVDVWDGALLTLVKWAHSRVARHVIWQMALQAPRVDPSKPPQVSVARADAINACLRYVANVRKVTTESMEISLDLEAVIRHVEGNVHHILKNLPPPSGMHFLDFRAYFFAAFRG